MQKNTGKQYEALLHEIYTALASNDQFASVERDVFLDGTDGPRQIDVLIRSQVAGMPLKTVIECRDFKKRLDVTAVDAFQSKLIDVGANKGVLVSRNGFSGTAIKKARRVGITLCTASNASEILSSLGIQIPVVISETIPSIQHFGGTINLGAGATFNKSEMHKLNGQTIHEIFREEIINRIFTLPSESGPIEWTPTLVKPPYFMVDTQGEKHYYEQMDFSVTLNVEYYFGHMSDLPEAYALHNRDEGSTHIFLKAEDIPNAKQRMAKYQSKEVIPKVNAISIFTIALPDIQGISGTIENIDTGDKIQVDI